MNRKILAIGLMVFLTGRILFAEELGVAYHTTGYPGEQASYSFLIHSPQPASKEYALDLKSTIPELRWTFLLDGKAMEHIRIDAGASLSLDLKVDTPETTAPGTYELRAVLTGQNGETMIIPCSLTLNPAFSLAVTSKTDELSVMKGREIRFPVHIRNTGKALQNNTRVDFSLPSGWMCSATPQAIPGLPPGQTAEFLVRLKAPRSQSSSGQTIDLRALSDSSRSTDVSIPIRVRQNPAVLFILIGILLSAFMLLLYVNYLHERR
jgi:uncharacterized membrane protein